MSEDWWSRGSEAIDEGLALYQERTDRELERHYDELAEAVRERNPMYMTSKEVAFIVGFKTWAGIRSWSRSQVSPDPVVRDLTRQGFAHARDGNPRAAIATVKRINRVGVPTASAILAAGMPGRFGIIDRFVMYETGLVAEAWLVKGGAPEPSLALLTRALALWAGNWPIAAYEPYSEGLRTRAEELGLDTARTFEKVLYGFALKRLR